MPSPVAWKIHLRETGAKALRGRPVELSNEKLGDEHVKEACEYFLKQLDLLLIAAAAKPGDTQEVHLRAAYDGFNAAITWCVGAALYDADGDNLLADIADEMREARASLLILDPAHWEYDRFARAVAWGEEKLLRGRSWTSRYERLAFSYKERAANAA